MSKKPSEMPFYVSPVCFNCVHKYSGYRICEAFDYIPDDIWEAKNKHDSPYKNDRGIQFEQRNGDEYPAGEPPEHLVNDWLGWQPPKP